MMEVSSTPNSAKDVIAIEPEEERNSQLKPENRTFGIPAMDRTILPRVKHYLKEHKAVYVDIDEMVDDLRRAYHEYGRRKRIPFKLAVEQAFERIVQMHKGEDESAGHSTSEEEDEDDDDPDDPEEAEEMKLANERLMVMYSAGNLRKRPQLRGVEDDEGGGGAERELINISSDESGKEESPPQNVANGTLSKNAPPVPDSQASKANNLQPVTKSTPPQAQQPALRTYSKRKRPGSTETSATQQTKRRKEASTVVPKTTFEDIGGNAKVLEEICQLLIHIRHPEVYKQIGVSPPRGFLLHGPPGCGKTLLAQAISGELQVPMISVAAPELVAGVSGESEERIRDLFNQAVATAPCILFLDEIDAITPNRHTAQREMERRIVAQLLSCLDELGQKENGDRIVVIGATNRPDALDPALRRAGRFDREVCLGIPDEKARIEILEVLCKKLKLPEDFDFHYVAKNTPGFVGADLTALTREAAVTAVNRVFAELQNKAEEKMEVEESEVIVEPSGNKPTGDNTPESTVQDNKIAPLENTKEKTSCHLKAWLLAESPIADEDLRKLTVTLDDFKTALKCVQPSAKREGFATIPDVTWEDIGSLKDIREELQMTILAPVRYPEQFKELGISTPSGVLLCGPPGCGKTLLAKAVANEAGINFISVKGPELLNMYVGESEKAVRQCFQRARNSAPCVIFFDEIDALCPKRSDSGEGGASMRVVNQMLTEMDGIESRKGVFLMAASNRPDIIDPAVLRPGRLDKLLYIGLPSAADRIDILKAITKNGERPCLDSDVDLEAIATNSCCERYTGADLAALVREAGIEALKEYMNSSAESKELVITSSTAESKTLVITNKHFLNAFKKVRPSVSERDQKHYVNLQTMYSSVSREDSS